MLMYGVQCTTWNFYILLFLVILLVFLVFGCDVLTSAKRIVESVW